MVGFSEIRYFAFGTVLNERVHDAVVTSLFIYFVHTTMLK